MQPSTRIILVRHGRSTFNDQGRYQGSSNQSVLTEKGIATSQLVGKYLNRVPVDIIYASPLHRVQQTAAEISKMMDNHPPITVSSDLKEISLSHWEGLTYAQVKEQFADDYHRWQHQPHNFELSTSLEPSASRDIAVATKTYFPVRDLYREAHRFWVNMLSRHAGSTVLVVSHSGTIHALLSTALSIAPSAHHSLQQSNCGISELIFSGQSFSRASVQLRQLNQTSAIGETLPKLKVSKQGLRLLLLPSAPLLPDSYAFVAERLKDIAVDFCLSADEDREQLQPLIHQHPKALWLGAQKPNFLQDWQRHLSRCQRPAETLMTGLAIAPVRSIQKLLIQTLGGHIEECDHLFVRTARLSVIHYSYTHRPVVQAMNL
ncbi:MAG: histidine phosphatase family protein [Cyanobacteria bacterium P01_D01_bin.1]